MPTGTNPLDLYDVNGNPVVQGQPAGTSPTLDPYVRGLALRGYQKAVESGNLLTDTGYNQELQQRKALATEAITAPAAPILEQGMKEVSSQYQKAGKLASSAATMGLKKTSEEYTTGLQARLAESILNIYSGLGTERESQRQTISNAALSLYGTEAGLATAGAEQQTAFRGQDIQKEITTIQSDTSQAIAELNARTDLSVADKQIEITRLNNISQEKIAQLNATTAITTTGMGVAGQTGVTNIQAQAQRDIAAINARTDLSAQEKQVQIANINAKTQVRIAEIQTASEQTIAKWKISADEAQQIKSLSQQDKQFFAQLNAEDQRLYLQLGTQERIAMQQLTSAERVEYAKLGSAEKTVMLQLGSEEKIAFARMTNEMNMLNINLQADKSKFDTQLSEMARQFGIGETNKILIARENIAASLKELNITTGADMTKFTQNLQWSITKGYMDDATSKQLASDKIKADVVALKLTSENDMTKFAQSMTWAREQGYMDNATTRQLAADKIMADTANLNLTLAADRTKYMETLSNAITLKTMDTASAKDMLVTQLSWEKTKFNTSNAEQWKQLQATLKNATDLKILDSNTALQISSSQILENSRQFDITTSEGNAQFWAQFALSKNQQNMDAEKWKDESRRWYTQFEESQKQFTITNTQDNIAFWENLTLAKSKFGWDKETWTANYNKSVEDTHNQLLLANRSLDQDDNHFWASYALDRDKTNVAKEEWTAEFLERQRQFEVTTTTGNTQFWANMDLAKSKFGWDQATWQKTYDKALTDTHDQLMLASKALDNSSYEFWANYSLDRDKTNIATNQWQQAFGEGQRQYDTTTKNGMTQFWSAFDQGVKNDLFDQSYKTSMMTLARDQFVADVKDKELTRAAEMKIAADNLSWSKEKGYLDDTTTRYLATETIKEQARQFDVKTANDLELSWAGFNENVRQFGIGTEMQLALATETLKINMRTLTDNEMVNRMNMLVGVLDSEKISELFQPIKDDKGNIINEGEIGVLAGIVYDLLDPENDTIGEVTEGAGATDFQTVIAAILDKYGKGDK